MASSIGIFIYWELIKQLPCNECSQSSWNCLESVPPHSNTVYLEIISSQWAKHYFLNYCYLFSSPQTLWLGSPPNRAITNYKRSVKLRVKFFKVAVIQNMAVLDNFRITKSILAHYFNVSDSRRKKVTPHFIKSELGTRAENESVELFKTRESQGGDLASWIHPARWI